MNFQNLSSYFPENLARVIQAAGFLTQAPIGIIVNSMLSAASIAVQRTHQVKRPNGQVNPTSLFVLTIAESGERKTTVDKLFTEPYFQYEREQSNVLIKARQTYETNLEIWNIKKEELIKEFKKQAKKGQDTEEIENKLKQINQEKPREPEKFRLIYQDVTPEALISSLNFCNKSVALVSNEAASILGGRTMQNLAQLNKLWDGDRIVVDRKTHQEEYVIDDARLTISLMTQPGSFRKFIEKNNGSSFDIGFIARCLILYPYSTQGIRYDMNLNLEEQKTIIESFQRRLIDLYLNLTPTTLEFTSDAAQRYRDIYNIVESRIGNGGDLSDAKGFASKYCENMARIAGILTALAQNDCITLEIVQYSDLIMSFYLNEYKRLFSDMGVMSQNHDSVMKIREWFERMDHQGCGLIFKRQDVRVRIHADSRDKSSFDKSINILINRGIIFEYVYNKTHFLGFNKYGLPIAFNCYYDFKYAGFFTIDGTQRLMPQNSSEAWCMPSSQPTPSTGLTQPIEGGEPQI
jgi:Protein of unknown function (DUF3987)